MTINREEAIEQFRADELDAVMLSVDKWLDGDELKNNPATRAADAREKALRAIEKIAAERDALKKISFDKVSATEMISRIEQVLKQDDVFDESVVRDIKFILEGGNPT